MSFGKVKKKRDDGTDIEDAEVTPEEKKDEEFVVDAAGESDDDTVNLTSFNPHEKVVITPRITENGGQLNCYIGGKQYSFKNGVRCKVSRDVETQLRERGLC